MVIAYSQTSLCPEAKNRGCPWTAHFFAFLSLLPVILCYQMEREGTSNFRMVQFEDLWLLGSLLLPPCFRTWSLNLLAWFLDGGQQCKQFTGNAALVMATSSQGLLRMLGLGTGEGCTKPLCFSFARSAAVFKGGKKNLNHICYFFCFWNRSLHSFTLAAGRLLLCFPSCLQVSWRKWG